MKAKIFVVSLCASALLFAGCNRTQSKQKEAFVLKVAASDEVMPWLAQELSSFGSSSNLGGLASDTYFETISISDAKAAHDLSAGVTKAHVWIAASETIVEAANSDVVNLGGHYIDCRPLFSTPVISVTNFTDASSTNPYVLPHVLPHVLFVGDPLVSVSGLGALTFSDKYSDGAHNRRVFVDTNRAIETANGSDPQLRTEIILTEQQLSTFTKSSTALQQHNQNSNMRWLDYTVCVAQGAWVLDKAAVASQVVASKISAPQALSHAQSFGFRPVRDERSKAQAISDQMQEKISQFRKDRSLPDVALLIDISGSMAGSKLEAVRNDTSPLLEKNSADYRHRSFQTFTFGAVPQFLGDDPVKVQRTLQNITPAGGGVLLDGLLAAGDNLSQIASPARRAVIAIIDGPDKGSKATTQEFKTRFIKLVQDFGTELYVIAIAAPPGELDETARIIRSVGGRISIVPLTGLKSAINEMTQEVF